jgi:hypothetical protein
MGMMMCESRKQNAKDLVGSIYSTIALEFVKDFQ